MLHQQIYGALPHVEPAPEPEEIITKILIVALSALASELIKQISLNGGMMPEECPETVDAVLDDLHRLDPEYTHPRLEEFRSLRRLSQFGDLPDFAINPSIAYICEIVSAAAEWDDELNNGDTCHALRDLGWIA